MDNTPTAPAEASQAPESVATPINTNPDSAQVPQMPDMHGFTSEDLAGMRTFIDNNGGWDKIKSRISNPTPEKPAEPAVQTQVNPVENPTSQPQPAPEVKTPEGAITAQEFLVKQYFKSLAGEEKYQAISSGIANGDYLKEMSAFGINVINPDGSINDQKVKMYLNLKAQTVPAKATSTQPDASAAPTVTYTPVGDKIENIDQAYKVLMEAGNPNMAKAEEYIRNHFGSSKK